MFQQVILVGNVGQDPELRHTTNGNAVANFSLATNQRIKGEERTEWHRIVCWAKLAEMVAEHVQKGSSVLVTGELRTRDWEDNEGTKRYTTEVHVRDFRFVGKRYSADEAEDDDDDIPFDG